MLHTQPGRMFKAITTVLMELFNFSITSGSILKPSGVSNQCRQSLELQVLSQWSARPWKDT